MNEPRQLWLPARAEVASTPKRLKVLVLSTEAMTEMLHGRKLPRVPADAVVLRDQTRFWDKQATWLIYSAMFEQLAPDQPAPAVYPAMEIIR